MDGTIRYRTRCALCQHPFSIRPSLAMQLGENTGYASCPKCKESLHIELLEGDEAWSEPWNDYLARLDEGRGLSLLNQFVRPEAR